MQNGCTAVKSILKLNHKPTGLIILSLSNQFNECSHFPQVVLVFSIILICSFKQKHENMFLLLFCTYLFTVNAHPVVFSACLASCRVSFSLRGYFNCVNWQSGSSLTRWPKVKEKRPFPSRARSGQKDQPWHRTSPNQLILPNNDTQL